MPDFDWINDRYFPEPARENLNWLLSEERVIESPDTLERPLQMLRKPRRRLQLRALRQEKLEEFLQRLPEPGETLHVVSNGSFDYWNFAPVTLQLLARKNRGPAVFYGSTWTMNRSNVLQLLSLYDQKKLSSVTMFSGLYFKRREPAVYTALASGLIDRGLREPHKNHADRRQARLDRYGRIRQLHRQPTARTEHHHQRPETIRLS